MYQNHEFHDSYYYHTCVVATEKDVLETDITGSGCATKLMRWWHDLFLLSYTSGRARGFYNSSHAMKMERFKQFRKYKHRIHPLSKFRNVWDFLFLHVFIINKIIFIFTSSFIYSELPQYLFYIGAVCELIIIADLYVNLKTGYIEHDAKRVILETEKSLLYYCMNKLFMHVAASTPLHWLMFLRYGHKISCGLCKANRFICALKIISIFSLFRVIEASAYYTRKCRSSNSHQFFKFLRIATIGFVTLCQFYDLSDAIILLVIMGTGRLAPSKLGMKAGLKYVCRNCDKSNSYNFGLAVNRILKSFQLHGFGMAKRIYYLDRVTALIGYGISKVFYAWTLFECYALLSPYVYPEDKSMHLRKKVLNILSANQLSDDLNLKVGQYFDFRPTRYKAMEKHNELIRMLPEVLKKEAKLSCYLKLMMRIPYFTDFTLPILEEIVLLLREEIYLKNTIVAEPRPTTCRSCKKTPKKRVRTKGKIEVDEYDLQVIRRKIHEFYAFKKEVPTINKLLHILKEEINFKGSRETLRKILRKNGFQFRKTKNNKEKEQAPETTSSVPPMVAPYIHTMFSHKNIQS